MNKDEDPLKKDLPDSDYESVKENLTSPEDSDNSSIERYLPEVAKRKTKDNRMSNQNAQDGSQANNNNNNFTMPTAKEYYLMAATVQRLEAAAAAPPPPSLLLNTFPVPNIASKSSVKASERLTTRLILNALF
ncbi:hypothetical protein Pst134EA_017946 [Puccinia striiformis f. sp. tritici]|uniref:hypothetical protein n=1 Tax=Puccinia striiformis f. sp. tritici TaxID=168172 RepID=UPI002007BB3B|nr:hypothetical protein Pst134EA_017946 [Puccinia striiformis f. sp. tritici]KAH9461653.1 hypothetical protein Pst134EA_017946 [Puccinia striiformis f. sp. tritici]